MFSSVCIFFRHLKMVIVISFYSFQQIKVVCSPLFIATCVFLLISLKIYLIA